VFPAASFREGFYQVRLQAGLLAPGSSFRRILPIRTTRPNSGLKLATVVTGYSGASAADSHGLPFSSFFQRTFISEKQISQNKPITFLNI
jgi:hypothetical protein